MLFDGVPVDQDPVVALLLVVNDPKASDSERQNHGRKEAHERISGYVWRVQVFQGDVLNTKMKAFY